MENIVNLYLLYIIKLFAHIYLSAIAGYTAGPNRLTFFSSENPKVTWAKKKKIFFKIKLNYIYIVVLIA